jgi:hypothetical protein
MAEALGIRLCERAEIEAENEADWEPWDLHD